MMDEMKLLWFGLAAAAAFAGDLSQVRTVYLLPMAAGLDQHLAERLTQEHVLQVVTDPSRADAVLSDRLGPSFEQQMTDLYPPPPPPAAKTEKAKAEDKEKEKEAAPAAVSPMLGDTVNKLSKPASSFGGGKGTVFLVGVKSREVLWSTYEPPKDRRGPQLAKVAAKICEDLKKSLGK